MKKKKKKEKKGKYREGEKEEARPEKTVLSRSEEENPH